MQWLQGVLVSLYTDPQYLSAYPFSLVMTCWLLSASRQILPDVVPEMGPSEAFSVKASSYRWGNTGGVWQSTALVSRTTRIDRISRIIITVQKCAVQAELIFTSRQICKDCWEIKCITLQGMAELERHQSRISIDSSEPNQTYSSTMLTFQQQKQIAELLKSKISVYMKCRPTERRGPSLNEPGLRETRRLTHSIGRTARDLPRVPGLEVLVRRHKQLYLAYRDKLQNAADQCSLLYMDILCAAVRHECSISHEAIDSARTVVVDCFIFVACSLMELGAEKLAFFFCCKAILLCEVYGKYLEIGRLLLVMGTIAQKLQKLDDSVVFYKKGLEYLWRNRCAESQEFQIEIYNLLSQCLLQQNEVELSRIFAYKYELGYVEKQSSKLVELSRELSQSVQSRKSKYHCITRQTMELLLGFDIEALLDTHWPLLGKLDQNKFMEVMKIKFEYIYDSFLQDDMFFYQISLPLELIVEVPRMPRRKSFDNYKLLVKGRARSLATSQSQPKLLRVQAEKIREFHIFNYRGVGISVQRMLQYYNKLIAALRSAHSPAKTQEASRLLTPVGTS